MILEDFYNRADDFLEKLRRQLVGKIDFQPCWWIDHICYRTGTLERYLKLKQIISGWAELLIESEVGGRPIATFKLMEPVYYGDDAIYILELPAPKAGKNVSEGFEHVEVVCNVPFEILVASFPLLKFNEKGLAKSFNPELELELDDMAIKFHHLSLASVIEFEKRENIFKAVNDLGILTELKPFSPEVVGTIPLGIDAQDSDVAILLYSENLKDLADYLKNLYQHLEYFNLDQQEINEEPSLIATFKFSGVQFEIFAQTKSVMMQDGFIHFQVEERLLELGNKNFKQKISESKRNGVKTEPAFAELLGLVGEPYHALKYIHHLSNHDLRLVLGDWKKDG